MQPKRWTKTRLLPGLGLELTMNYGTTGEKASITVTATGTSVSLGKILVTSPKLSTPLVADPISATLYKELEPSKANAYLWSELSAAYQAYRATVAELGAPK
jgi:ABC-type uncharacterized transport system substrate-binding protein